MNILITGNAGLIGSRLADWLLSYQSEHTIIGIDDFSGGYKENVDSRVVHYNMDAQSEKVEDIFNNHNIDIVYHFAAYAAEGLSPFIRQYNYKNNLVATANIVNNCIKYDVKRLVFTSTMAVYGIGNPPFDESHQPSPVDPYGIAKYACEMDIKVASDQHELDYCILRPHNVYGAKQNIWDKYRNVLGIWMYQYMNGEPLTIFGDGSQQRAFSCIDDALPCIWEAGTSQKARNEIINIGSTKEYTVNKAAETLADIVGGCDIVHLEQRHEVAAAFSTHGKSVDLLGYEDSTTLKQGLHDMWKWAKDQPNRKREIWKSYEIEKGMYTSWK